MKFVLGQARWLVVISFVLSYLLSTLSSYYIPISLNTVAVLFPGLLITYIIAHISQNQLSSVFTALMMLVLAPALMTIGMFHFSTFDIPEKIFEELRTPSLVVPNDLILGVIFLPVPAILLSTSPCVGLRLIAAFSIAALLTSLWLVESRLGLLIMAILIALYFYNRVSIAQFCILSSAIFSVALAFDWFFQLGIADNFVQLRTENARLSIWAAGLSRWGDNPILGFGPGHFEVAYRLGLTEIKLPDWILVEGRMIPWAHNLFIEALTERGALGFVTQTGLLVFIFLRLLRLSKARSRPSGIYYRGLLMCFVAFLIAALFELTLQRIWVANALFIFLGLSWRNTSGGYTANTST